MIQQLHFWENWQHKWKQKRAGTKPFYYTIVSIKNKDRNNFNVEAGEQFGE